MCPTRLATNEVLRSYLGVRYTKCDLPILFALDYCERKLSGGPGKAAAALRPSAGTRQTTLRLLSHAFKKSKFDERNESQMNTQKEAVKAAHDFGLWCAVCCIRIAPHEEQIAVDRQTYHPRCYSKHLARPTDDSSVKKSRK